MKTQNDILKALNLCKNSQNNKVANNFIKVLQLINEIKNDITSVEVVDFDLLVDPYKKTFCDLDKFFEVEFLKTVKISTSFGCYSVSVPTNTAFYSYLCVILKIESSYKKPIEVHNIQNSIFIENNAVESINKALKFTDIKSIFNLSNFIYLKFENDFLNVISTNRKVIYCSQKFDYIADNKIENLILSFPTSEVASFKTSKNDFLKIDILENNFVLINDNLKVELSTIDASQLNSFNYEVENKMLFSKVDFQRNIKSVKPLLDYRKTINLHLNGSIEIQPLTDKENCNTSIKMNYDSKDFEDKDYKFIFDNISNVVASFKTKDLIFSPKNINSKDIALITDNIDSFLIMNQINV